MNLCTSVLELGLGVASSFSLKDFPGSKSEDLDRDGSPLSSRLVSSGVKLIPCEKARMWQAGSIWGRASL